MNPVPATQGTHAPPIHLLAGGHRRGRRAPDPLLACCMKLAATPAPTVAYIGAASGDDLSFLDYLSKLFLEAGAGRVIPVPLANPPADIHAARDILSAADLVFVSGGDVDAGMQCLRRHAIIPFLRRLHRAGTPFFGLSAGSIMLARQWVRWTDPDDEDSAHPFRCMGLAPVLCDTHAEEDDWEELKTLLRLLPAGSVGYGIPSGGGLRISGKSQIEALGLPLVRFRHDPTGIRTLPPLPLCNSATL